MEMNYLSYFTLQHLSEGIVHIVDGRVGYVNQKLLDISKEHIIGILPEELPFFNLLNQQRFAQRIRDCANGKVVTDIFTINTRETDVITEVKFAPYDAKVICCIFQFLTASVVPEVIPKSLPKQTIIVTEQNTPSVQEQYQFFRTLFDNAPMLVGVVDIIMDPESNRREAKFLYTNYAMQREYKFYPNSSTSQLKIPNEETDAWISYYFMAAKAKQPIQFDRYYNSPYTAPHWKRCTVFHLDTTRFAFMSTDITDVKNMELELKSHQANLESEVQARTKQLEEALLIKSRFMAIMSHEIRTPMTGILGTLSLLWSSEISEEQRELVKIAQVCGEQLLLVINDVLDLTKIEENKMTLTSESFSLRQVIAESLDVVSFDAERKDIELVCNIDTSTQDLIFGDRGRLRQIMINLLSNAVKFSEKGEVVLTAVTTTSSRKHSRDFSRSSSDDSIEIIFSVRDHGIGISKTSQPYIFQPFTQADSSISKRYGGSGLGLNISKRLVELMGGKMWFESEENNGSIFYFTIITKRDVNFRPRRLSQQKFTDSSKRILILEQHETVLEVLHKNFGLWGYRVSSTGSVDKLFEFLNQSVKYDLIIMDAYYGIDLIQTIKELGMIVWIITNKREQIPGIQQYIKKPIHELNLQSMLQKHFGTEEITTRSNSIISISNSSILSKLNILVAEDNLMNQKVIQKLLLNIGFSHITVVDNGVKAIDKVTNNNFDLVLMDVMMPVCGGIEATEEIRKEHPEKPIIIALTADAFAENRKRCLESGMNDVITKPIKRTKLLESLNKFFPDVGIK